MEAIVKELSNYYLKRRLDGGAYVFYSLASKDCLEGRKAVINDLKSEEIMAEIKMNSNSSEVADNEFESLLLKAIVQLPYEKQYSSHKHTQHKPMPSKQTVATPPEISLTKQTPKTDDNLDIKHESTPLVIEKCTTLDNLGFVYEVLLDEKLMDDETTQKNRKMKFQQVVLKPLGKHTNRTYKYHKDIGDVQSITHEEWKGFFRNFENIVHVYRREVTKLTKHAKEPKSTFQGVHILKFNSEENAEKFLHLENLSFKGISFSAVMNKQFDNERYLKRGWITFCRYAKRMSLYAENCETGKLARQVWVEQIQYCSEEAVQEFFCGVETDFEGIQDVKRVVHEDQEKMGKVIPKYILTFASEDMAKKFVDIKDIIFKENKLEYFPLGGLDMRLKVGASIKNFENSKKYSEKDIERQVAVMNVNYRLEERYIDNCFNTIFTNIEDSQRCDFHDGFAMCFSGLYILTFKTADDAKKAIHLEPAKEGDLSLGYIAPLKEYLETRTKLIAELPLKKSCGESNKFVEISENSLTFGHIEDPKSKLRNKDTQTEMTKEDKIRKQRKLRKKHDLDLWIGCFRTDPYQGDIEEIRKYFEDNHENVEEVTSISSSEITGKIYFVKFKDAESAETFLCLPYTKFRGYLFSRMDVLTFLKKGKSETLQRNIVELLVGKFGLPFDKFEHKIELSGFSKNKFESYGGITEYFAKKLNMEVGEALQLVEASVWDVISEHPKTYKFMLGMKCDGSKALELVQQWNSKKITQNNVEQNQSRLITARLVSKDEIVCQKGIKRESEEVYSQDGIKIMKRF